MYNSMYKHVHVHVYVHVHVPTSTSVYVWHNVLSMHVHVYVHVHMQMYKMSCTSTTVVLYISTYTHLHCTCTVHTCTLYMHINLVHTWFVVPNIAPDSVPSLWSIQQPPRRSSQRASSTGTWWNGSWTCPRPRWRRSARASRWAEFRKCAVLNWGTELLADGFCYSYG